MSKVLNIAAAIAILATGITKADAATPPTVEADCLPRAQAAYATAVARDSGKSDRDMYRYVDSNRGQVNYRPIYKRIIFTVYNNHSLTPENAYNGEYTRCYSELFSNAPKKK